MRDARVRGACWMGESVLVSLKLEVGSNALGGFV